MIWILAIAGAGYLGYSGYRTRSIAYVPYLAVLVGFAGEWAFPERFEQRGYILIAGIAIWAWLIGRAVRRYPHKDQRALSDSAPS